MRYQGPVKLEKKHPLAIRWFHWINFPSISIMVYSGLLILWAQDPTFMIAGRPVIPDGTANYGGLGMLDFYHWLHLDGRLAEGISWHFFFMWFFAINGVLYAAYLILSGEWKTIVPQRGTLKSAMITVLHDMHLSKKEPPRAKFNGAQQIAYTTIILMGGLEVLTGIAIFKPTQQSWLTALFGGYFIARLIHFCIMLGFVGFFAIHVAQVIRAGWNNFRAMVTGYELAPAEEAPPENV